ncbi:hypothetical protein BXZ70DRAFT_1018621 [Cristinia sonorae]|uniref:Uncharacterized protein n=1 Tax=Cristinia sonorae TaxID=1940300 RepID=A0A8K0UPB5_9AGAR|nr:hypothetical protein BXZ70DRAFT_1018621 [Cristinia sonorae]
MPSPLRLSERSFLHPMCGGDPICFDHRKQFRLRFLGRLNHEKYRDCDSRRRGFMRRVDSSIGITDEVATIFCRGRVKATGRIGRLNTKGLIMMHDHRHHCTYIGVNIHTIGQNLDVQPKLSSSVSTLYPYRVLNVQSIGPGCGRKLKWLTFNFECHGYKVHLSPPILEGYWSSVGSLSSQLLGVLVMLPRDQNGFRVVVTGTTLSDTLRSAQNGHPGRDGWGEPDFNTVPMRNCEMWVQVLIGGLLPEI